MTRQEAIDLYNSDDLIGIGMAADAVRRKLHPHGVVSYIIDRNINYTNVCVTDCDFCAFYRRPGDKREGYVLPKPVIHKKIEETLALGGTAVLMQGGHHPDLGIEWYEDLFSGIKQRYKIHLHALSPPEIQHISRRSKLTTAETLSRLRDSGLDSLPGGGGEVLVDRVRQIIAPKKTKTADWLGVMREAHRLGMSTTATMRRYAVPSGTVASAGSGRPARSRPMRSVRGSADVSGRSSTISAALSASIARRSAEPAAANTIPSDSRSTGAARTIDGIPARISEKKRR